MAEKADIEHPWLVWSYEHDAWWRAGRAGYSTNVLGAGFYTEQDAADCCDKRGWVSHKQGMPPEMMCPAPEWLVMLRKNYA